MFFLEQMISQRAQCVVGANAVCDDLGHGNRAFLLEMGGIRFAGAVRLIFVVGVGV